MIVSRFGRRSPLRFYVFVATLLGAALACARADAPVNYANVTPIGYVTPFGGGGVTPLYEALPSAATATLIPVNELLAANGDNALACVPLVAVVAIGNAIQ